MQDSDVHKKRLDLMLVDKGLCTTRSRARDLIKMGQVLVDGEVMLKPGQLWSSSAHFALQPETHNYVSRGALKLEAAMRHFQLSANKCYCLDLGASTGGFTDVLLRDGAEQVIAVDVGTDQLHPKLRQDARVISLEGYDVCQLDKTKVSQPIDVITVDLSFISLTKALANPLKLARINCWLIALIKPQFEAGRELISKNGVVRDESVHDMAKEIVINWFHQQPHWHVQGVIDSPIEGKGEIKNF